MSNRSTIMGPLAIRRATHRVRRPALAIVAVLILGATVSAHHVGLPPDHHGDGAAGVAVMLEECLGVFTAVGAAVALVCGFFTLARRRAAPVPATGVVVVRFDASCALPRAGPPSLAALCIWRR